MTDEQLLAQMRDANERLVVATVRAERLAEDAARSEERFRTLVTASSAVVWRATAGGGISFEPDAWRAFTGLGPDTDWLDAIHLDDRERVRGRWQIAIETASMYVCEHRITRREGGYAWVIARAVPIVDHGKAREWVGMMTDVTERITLERARDEFMAVLGHDLRTPLASILLGAQALQQLALDAPYGGVVDDMCSSSLRMSALVHDLMDLARARLGTGIPVAPRPCDLGVLCAEIVTEAKHTNPSRMIAMATHGDCRGEWDPGRISQVLSNLLGNAVTHGTDPIGIMIVGEGEEVLFLITNGGPSIPPDVQARLFEPFFTVRNTADRRGIGLGLYIVNEIVRAHRGAIELTSKDGVTTFSVRLPRIAS